MLSLMYKKTINIKNSKNLLNNIDLDNTNQLSHIKKLEKKSYTSPIKLIHNNYKRTDIKNPEYLITEKHKPKFSKIPCWTTSVWKPLYSCMVRFFTRNFWGGYF